MSEVDPYAEFLAKERVEAQRKADELSMANQLAQFKAGPPQQGAAAPGAAQHLELPQRVLPATAAELRKELRKSIEAYHAAIEHVRSFDTKMAEARQAEVKAVTDDSGDEKKIVRAVSEAQGLASVYSRRKAIAEKKIPVLFGEIVLLAKALAQDLVNRCYGLAEERAAKHKAILKPRFDLESLCRTCNLITFPADFERGLDRLIDCCCPDVVAAKACVPHLSWLHMRVLPADFSLERLQWDLEALEKAEAAFEAEAAREYNFEEPAEVLAAQTVEV
jgi:hypothetical protein